MNTIPSQVSSAPVAGTPIHHSRARMDRSLVDLSSGAQAASAPADGDTASGVDASGLAATIARQNRLSALADAPAAAAANRGAAFSIGAQPASALAATADVSPEAAWGLLQD
jgi:hypothetical protein